MRLPVPQDDEIKRRLRMEQTDPLIMYFVVFQATQKPLAELCQDAAKAARQCAAQFGDDPEHKANFEKWFAGSFRKVTLRAKEKRFTDVQELKGVRVGDVFCLPPRAHSGREPILKKLQVLQTLELETLPAFKRKENGLVNLGINTDLGMSTGKTIAQVGHAALMAGGDPDMEITVSGIPAKEWEDVIAKYPVLAVRDGGITEIAPGSETVLVIDPPKKSFP
jgi:peptidyl-tRNA hydrolase